MKKLFIRLYRLIKEWEEADRQNVLRKKYKIHPSFKFNGEGINMYGNGEIIIGENSYIGAFSAIQTKENTKVEIGKGCSISHNVRIYSSSRYPDYDFSDKNQVPLKNKNVIIEDFVWIGANVFINPGVRIGRNSVIGANSVVTGNIEQNSIYGGVPAKLIRMKNRND